MERQAAQGVISKHCLAYNKMESFIKKIAKKAGKAIYRKYGKIGVKYTKTDASDVVTEADLIANKIIVDAIRRKYPNHSIISEETGEHKADSEYCWIIDPLDGTTNFARRAPLFVTQIALVKNGELELAAVYDICAKEMFFAKKGAGAFRDCKRIFCSKINNFADTQGLLSIRLNEKNFNVTERLYKYSIKNSTPCWVSSIGSAGIGSAYLADGRRDWRISNGGKVWDYAPTTLLMQESGCKVTNLKGESWSLEDREQISANPDIHKVLLEALSTEV